jgi:hypothetical protein
VASSIVERNLFSEEVGIDEVEPHELPGSLEISLLVRSKVGNLDVPVRPGGRGDRPMR